MVTPSGQQYQGRRFEGNVRCTFALTHAHTHIQTHIHTHTQSGHIDSQWLAWQGLGPSYLLYHDAGIVIDQVYCLWHSPSSRNVVASLYLYYATNND